MFRIADGFAADVLRDDVLVGPDCFKSEEGRSKPVFKTPSLPPRTDKKCARTSNSEH